jgi:exopolyphosphatase
MLSRSEIIAPSKFDFKEQDLAGLHHFLRSERERLRAAITLPIDDIPEVHIVLGNESADLDSVISAIVRAYHLFLIKDNNSIYLPFINIFREELELRKDVQYVLEGFGISADDLSFIDGPISLDSIHILDKLKLHLVDHNELNPDQAHLSDAVVDIIDHHADAQQYPPLQQKIIDTVGSCTTLVANEFIKLQSIEKMPKAFAGLLLAPVLMDTDNLQSVEKTKPADVQLKELLVTRAGNALPADFYDNMRAKKEDTSGLTTKLCLFKDFKKFRSGDVVYGMSSLGSSKGFWIENQADLLHDFEELTTKRGLDFLVLLMPYYNEGRHPQRKIVVYSISPEILAAFDAFVRVDEFLHKKMILENSSTNIYFYSSHVFFSRKDVQPRINDISKNESFMATYGQAKQLHLKRSHELYDIERNPPSPLRVNSLFLGSGYDPKKKTDITVPAEPGL